VSVQAGPDRPRIQAVDLAGAPDPYPRYARLRAAGPVVRGEFGQWLVPGHAAAADLLRDPRLASHFPRDFIRLALGAGPAASFPQRIVLTRDPPDHTMLRRFLGAAFGTTAVRAMAADVHELVDTLFAAVRPGEPFDVVAGLAVPLPVTVVCRLIGIPDADRDVVLPKVISLARVFDAANLTAAERDAVDEAVTWLRGYLADLVAAAEPDAAAATLVGVYARAGGPIPLTDLVDNLLFLFHAGFETTMGLISNGCAALLAHPGQYARLRADPGLVPGAVDEFLRYDAPIQNAIRVAREPIEIGGHKIRTGRSVMLLLGAANRDPTVFARPDRLDLTRTPNPHLGFGGGLHHCLGTPLARLMGEAFFAALAGRYRRVEPGGTARRRRHGSLRAFERLDLLLHPA